jgi:hypothetical protein
MALGSGGPTPAEVQKYLGGVDYPAGKDDLVNAARRNGAPREVLDVLGRLPDTQFDGPPGVMKALGQAK